jgi:hypothetical protein
VAIVARAFDMAPRTISMVRIYNRTLEWKRHTKSFMGSQVYPAWKEEYS